MSNRTSKISIIITILILATACNGGVDTEATAVAENDATEISLQIEETIEVLSQGQTQVAADEAATSEVISAQETQKAIEEASAAAEVATQEAISAAATQEVEDQLAAIDEVLQEVGYSTSIGNLGWVESGPTSLRFLGGNTWDYSAAGGDKEYENFVIHYDVTWELEGWGGCGMIFRSEKDLQNGYQYKFTTLRLSGLPLWAVELYRYGDYISTTAGGSRPSNYINIENGSTTNYVLVAEDTVLAVYINGIRSSATTIVSRTSGYFGYYGWQQSGATTCTYENVWVWEIP